MSWLTSILGTAVGGLVSDYSARRQNDMAYDMSRKLQDNANVFSREMFDKQFEANKWFQQRQFALNSATMQNAHQWEVSDLRKAGLNPMLSAMNGSTGTLATGNSSVSAPQGATAPLNSAPFNILDAASSVMNLKRTQAEIDNINSSSRLNDVRSKAEMMNAETNRDTGISVVVYNQTMAQLNRTRNHIEKVKGNLDIDYQLIKNSYASKLFQSEFERTISEAGLNVERMTTEQVNRWATFVEVAIKESTAMSENAVRAAKEKYIEALTEGVNIDNKTKPFENSARIGNIRASTSKLKTDDYKASIEVGKIIAETDDINQKKELRRLQNELLLGTGFDDGSIFGRGLTAYRGLTEAKGWW